MKKLQTQLKQLQSAHSLSKKEKVVMRDTLAQYIELKPVRQIDHKTHNILRFNILWQHKLASAALMLILSLSSGAGAVYASTDALPGDTLYFVKEIAEDLHERVLFSDEARINLAERLTERRELEAQRLQKLGNLDDARMAILDRRVAKHKRQVGRVLIRLEAKTPQKVALIRANLANKSKDIHIIKQQSSALYFASLLQEIESLYTEQEEELVNIVKEIAELEKSY
ncbi:MAG: DUF5667 domain-containing protein [Candidatus Pacebacteria bacterium]|nr:DUF5667 domain-containing protein [Candidatus Paceibacterota bacterium]